MPQEYKLLGYQPHPLPSPDSYVAPGLLRPLRTGAREEVEVVGLPPSPQGGLRLLSAGCGQGQCWTLPSPPGSTPIGLWPLAAGCGLEGGEVHVTDLEEEEGGREGRETTSPIIPPSSLFDAPAYPPLHIFVSLTGQCHCKVVPGHPTSSLCPHRCLVGVSRQPLPQPPTRRGGCSATSSPSSATRQTKPSYKRR